jgi:hypothetical protein
MGLTLLGGVLFLVVKAFEYGDKFAHGLLPSTNNFPRPLLHDDRAARPARDRRDGRQRVSLGAGRAPVASQSNRCVHQPRGGGRLYWHFVDLVWIFLFPVLYLL